MTRLCRGDRQPAPAEHAYHLAHGLFDYAEHRLGRGDAEGAAAAIEQARGIGTPRVQRVRDAEAR